MWNNLISNAVKFTEPGGNITVRQKVNDGNVIVSISDSGCGMNEESIRYIWNKFYQGDTSHSKEGNGLGLAMVKRVMNLMDGNIQVSSKKGKGSTFTVMIKSVEKKKKKRIRMVLKEKVQIIRIRKLYLLWCKCKLLV